MKQWWAKEITHTRKSVLKSCVLDSPAPSLIPAAVYRLGELWTLFTGQRVSDRDALLWARPPLSGVCLFAHAHAEAHMQNKQKAKHMHCPMQHYCTKDNAKIKNKLKIKLNDECYRPFKSLWSVRFFFMF